MIKPIREGYFVSAEGKVFSEKYGRRCELKQSEHKGYRRVCFSTNNKRQHFPVHRLVAEAFVENPDIKPFVNHKDGNKRNNHFTNLEWATASENQKHAYTELNIRNGHTGYRYAKLYPSEELRSRLVELGIPRWKHNLAELGEILPFFTESQKYDVNDSQPWMCRSEIDAPGHNTCADTEANARAAMLVYLIEQGIVKP